MATGNVKKILEDFGEKECGAILVVAQTGKGIEIATNEDLSIGDLLAMERILRFHIDGLMQVRKRPTVQDVLARPVRPV
jgi:hypothetical protein